jgi:hypothetical protein
MARKMNERPKRVNVSARLDVWCSGLFIPLAKTQRRIIWNSRHVQLRPRQHSAPYTPGARHGSKTAVGVQRMFTHSRLLGWLQPSREERSYKCLKQGD